MKVTLEFDTTDPDQKKASIRAQKAIEAYLVMLEFDEYLRSMIKYDDNLDQSVVDKLIEVREMFAKIQEDRGIDMRDLE